MNVAVFRVGLTPDRRAVAPPLNDARSRAPLAERNLDPLAVLIDERARLLDRKATRETWITLQKAINCFSIARRHFPFSIFTNQVLLDHQLAVAVERLGDVREHRRINDRQVPRDAYRSDFNSLKLKSVLTSLQTL